MQDIRDNAPFLGPMLLERSIEPRRLEALPWPKDLFGEPALIADLLEESARESEWSDVLCSRPCRRERTRELA